MGIAVYLPGVVLTLVDAGFSSGLLLAPGATLLDVREALDRSWMGLLTFVYMLSGVVLHFGYRHAEDPIIRQQLKWLRNGMLVGFAPFGVLYAIPFVFDVQFSPYLNYAVITLPLIPLTIAYAIMRYRLMDVDIIFRRGFAYTVATICILTGFYSVVFAVGSLAQKNLGRHRHDFHRHADRDVPLSSRFCTWICREKLDRHFCTATATITAARWSPSRASLIPKPISIACCNRWPTA